MIPAPFEYHRPASLAEATGLLAELGEDAHVLAGGHSLIPMMKLRLAAPEHLIDLQDIAELKGITRTSGEGGGNDVIIGAMTTQHELIASDELARAVPLIREAALQIADPQVRYLGTIGGNVANGDPGNDMPGLMQCLDATFELDGPNGRRRVAAREFYRSAYVTAREDGEILSRIRIPVPAPGHGFAYEKLKRKIGDYATAAAAVLLTVSGGRCDSASVALTNLADTPVFAADAGAALAGSDLGAAAVDAAVAAVLAAIDPAADNRGPVAFKQHVAGVMLRRAIARATERATERAAEQTV
ncbi:MAG: xanthine dehydrogenase family protein subunit M [Proteobacteria bacterium]|nr:xanthine dehydrogenase family protein subunit M [Pseudomonadota bacterium]